jgi:hypothetical protein
MVGKRRERHDVAVTERTDRSVPGSIRAVPTLLGAAGAGVLIWLASYFDLAATSGFWSAMGLIMGAGFALGLSQLIGGWTKWGALRVSPGMLLFAFLPIGLVTAWTLLATQPAGGWQQERLAGWSEDIGIMGFISGLGTFPAALTMGLGLVLSFSFDTTGRRERLVDEHRVLSDEEVDDYQRRGDELTTTTAGSHEHAAVGAPRAERTEVTTTGPDGEQVREERVEIRDPSRRGRDLD